MNLNIIFDLGPVARDADLQSLSAAARAAEPLPDDEPLPNDAAPIPTTAAGPAARRYPSSLSSRFFL